MKPLAVAAALALASCQSNTTGSCASTADCPASQICADGACVPGCDDTHGCDGGTCDAQSHTCVPWPCTSDKDCAGATPRCDVAKHACVPCLPANDNCAKGSYCGADETCHPGCKSDGDCANGKCLADHSCGPCASDAECTGGKVCEKGTCVAPCGVNSPCANGGLCCAQHCFDAMNDPANCGNCGHACAMGESCCAGTCATLDTAAHCGACGNACGASQGCCGGACKNLSTLTDCGACGNACAMGDFCDGKACQKPTYPNFCNNLNVYVIHDNIAADDGAGDLMASTITIDCPKGVKVMTGSQTDAMLVDQTTGEPLAGGGVTYVLGGGPYANNVVKWLERTEKVTKIYFALDGVNYYWKLRKDDSVVAQMPGAGCTPHHDQFISELVADPNNGTLSLIGYGACPGGLGTKVAAWYYSNVLLPNRAKYPDSWYVFDWTDTDNDGAPSLGDTYTILAHGS